MSIKLRFVIGILLLSVLCSSCTTVKTLVATGGSRTDGIVELSYEVGMFEQPKVRWDHGLITANDRCKMWGYQSAEAFGGTTSRCQAFNGYGHCTQLLVSAKYQCIGDPSKQNMQVKESNDLYSNLKKLKELADSRVITEEEFQVQKKKLLEKH